MKKQQTWRFSIDSYILGISCKNTHMHLPDLFWRPRNCRWDSYCNLWNQMFLSICLFHNLTLTWKADSPLGNTKHRILSKPYLTTTTKKNTSHSGMINGQGIHFLSSLYKNSSVDHKLVIWLTWGLCLGSVHINFSILFPFSIVVYVD